MRPVFLRHLQRWLAVLLAVWCCVTAADPVPSRKIVTLAPHLTEMVFAAGAGDRLVGVAEFSDYPPAALQVPRIGDAFRADYEAIVSVAPDLILAWTSGNPPAVVERLEALGFRVVSLEPDRLEDVAAHIEIIGGLTGTRAIAAAVAQDYRDRLASLRQSHRDRQPLTVFFQVSRRPLLTVTNRHVIGQALDACGGRNIFAELSGLTAAVSVEAVLDAAPEVVLAGGFGPEAPAELEDWRRWSALPAAREGNLFSVDADLVSRPGTRLVDGVAAICEALDEARARSVQR